MARNTDKIKPAAPAAPARIEPEEQRAAGPTPTPNPAEESTQKQEEQKQEEQKQEEQKQEEQKQEEKQEQKQEEQKQEEQKEEEKQEQKQEEQKQEEQKQEEQPDASEWIAHAVGGYYARALKEADGQERGMMKGIMGALLERPTETPPKEGARPAPLLVALTGSTEKVNNAGAGLLRQARTLAGKGATRADVAAWVAVIVASAIHEANAIRQDADLDARSVTVRKAIKAAQIKD